MINFIWVFWSKSVIKKGQLRRDLVGLILSERLLKFGPGLDLVGALGWKYIYWIQISDFRSFFSPLQRKRRDPIMWTSPLIQNTAWWVGRQSLQGLFIRNKWVCKCVNTTWPCYARCDRKKHEIVMGLTFWACSWSVKLSKKPRTYQPAIDPCSHSRPTEGQPRWAQWSQECWKSYNRQSSSVFFPQKMQPDVKANNF